MKRITFIISIVVLVLLLSMSTVFADNSFLPNDGELPVIRAVYEDGGTIYQGARVTLYSDYYLPQALTGSGDTLETVVFQWYENDVDSVVGGTAIPHQMGNNFIVDTSRIGTFYYYYDITYRIGGVDTETVTSDPICVTVEEKTARANPLSTLLTPAEASGWRLTTSSDQLIDWYETVAEHSDNRVKMFSMGETAGHKGMPLVIMGYPEAPESPDEVDSDKAVVLVNCNIHSGEVEGKEAMMIFAREVALGEHDDLLEDLVILLIPNFNADGNDNLGKRRISTQYTPKMVGTRFTGALINPYVQSLGIDYLDNSESHNFYNINRDMTKLDTVEARAAVNVMNEWDPVIFIDAHATNGSYMRHAITYNWGLHPNTDPDVLAYNRDVFCKNAVGEDSYLFEVQGKVAIPYGNFSQNNVTTPWTTFEDYPRYTTNYAGLRNRLALLLEVYSHDPYTVRVDTQYACIYGSLLAVQEDKDHIKELIAQADALSLARAVNGSAPEDKVALNSTLEYLYDLTLLGYKDGDNNRVISFNMIDDEGDRCGTLFAGTEEYVVPYKGLFVPSGEEDMGAYYLIDSDCAEAIQLLNYHGIEYSRLSEPITIAAGDFQWYDITQRNQYAEPTSSGTLGNFYEGHLRNRFSGSWEIATAPQIFPAGTYVVSTAQNSGSLA
ncbi:MAG: M14 family metallopeptidase, partial [Dehalobacterium sp.]